MKIAILGFAVEGRVAFNYWNKDENQITICDQNESIKIPSGIRSKLGSDYLSNLDEFDLIVRSPGLNPSAIVHANSPSILNKITSPTNEFFRVSPTKKIIGVTGTKGKGTTSTLIANLLAASGYRVHLGGNIGTPALSFLSGEINANDWVVLELSSYQLTDLKYSPHIGVCLMISPEHLNWHLSLESYIEAKSNIFRHQSDSDIAIYYADNKYSTELAGQSKGKKMPYFDRPGAYVEDNYIMIDNQRICNTNQLKLLGRHNWQNVCAALTAYWQVDNNIDIAKNVITQFHGLPHRIELVREENDIKYYNDSFASAPDAAMAALEAVSGNKVMIMGGFDRGLELLNLANSIKLYEDEIKKIILIGESAERLASMLKAAGFVNYKITDAKTMGQIVKLAKSYADPNDAVILSPGFPSFDMFRDFEDRGQQYKDAVKRL